MKRYFFDAGDYSDDVIKCAYNLYSDMCSIWKTKMVEKNLVIKRLLNCINSFKSTSVKLVYDFYFSKMSFEQIASLYELNVSDVKEKLVLGSFMLFRQQKSFERWFLISEHTKYLQDELQDVQKYLV